MKKTVPPYDPQTGDLNPYYEELTGKPNPMKSIHNPELYAKIMNKDFEYQSKVKSYQDFLENNRVIPDVSHMPNQKWHRIVSFIKSGIRLVGYSFIPFDLITAAIFLFLSEIIGIFEELV